jgi:DNA recombination protein RmuC
MLLFLLGFLFGLISGSLLALYFLRTRMTDSFKLVAQEVLEKNAAQQSDTLLQRGESQLDLKKQSIDLTFEEIKKQLQAATTQIQTFERERTDQYGRITEKLQNVIEQELKLGKETAKLRTALTTSQSVRGRWGELVLRNILEQSDLVKGVDFIEQNTATNADGNLLKPDVIIRLPQAGQHLVIDAKTSLFDAYLDSENSPDEAARTEAHKHFAKMLWSRVLDLSSKDYSAHVSDSLPYVVLFVPSEAAIRAAFDIDPDLFKKAMEKKIFITSPATIIPLILLIAQGWRQHRMTKQASELGATVKQLGQRLKTFVERLGKVQSGIETASKAWNEAIEKSWNGQQSVVKSIEKAQELGAELSDLPDLNPVITTTKALHAPETGATKSLPFPE